MKNTRTPGSWIRYSVELGIVLLFVAVVLGGMLVFDVFLRRVTEIPSTVLQNVTPADVYYGRQATILSRRERIKQATLKRLKRMNRRAA